MTTERILLIAAAAVASLILGRLMQNRQRHLTGLLRQYVDRQKEWVLKRSKAAAMARQAAVTKERGSVEEEAAITDMLHKTPEFAPIESPAPVEA